MQHKSNKKVLARNKVARYNYDFSKKYTAGIVLQGFEVKSAKDSNVDLKESYVRVENNEAIMYGAYISLWKYSRVKDYDPKRSRKLLLAKKELKEIKNAQEAKNMSIIPLEFIIQNNIIKVKLGIGKGRKKYDKRERIKEREQRKQIQSDLADAKRF